MSTIWSGPILVRQCSFPVSPPLAFHLSPTQLPRAVRARVGADGGQVGAAARGGQRLGVAGARHLAAVELEREHEAAVGVGHAWAVSRRACRSASRLLARQHLRRRPRLMRRISACWPSTPSSYQSSGGLSRGPARGSRARAARRRCCTSDASDIATPSGSASASSSSGQRDAGSRVRRVRPSTGSGPSRERACRASRRPTSSPLLSFSASLVDDARLRVTFASVPLRSPPPQPPRPARPPWRSGHEIVVSCACSSSVLQGDPNRVSGMGTSAATAAAADAAARRQRAGVRGTRPR